ncbi:hypothetical protein [Halostagnicola sp. A-GB9-2]|uniref:hypothetical protein n=1 Tax=Halostagnicola sp. A-GB9-2 TaxID=3048066 RepID=UPI0024C0642F|nr:hypothetical protein [Halostagnicola sp. A-GB9-2]MDJ1430766.1 hypothetical protein [Halostagnicola sp. A-GB9-2]
MSTVQNTIGGFEAMKADFDSEFDIRELAPIRANDTITTTTTVTVTTTTSAPFSCSC